MQCLNNENYEPIPPLDSLNHSNHTTSDIVSVKGSVAPLFDGMVETIEESENLPSTSYSLLERSFDPFAHLLLTSFLEFILTRRHQPKSSHRRNLGMLEFLSLLFPFPMTSIIINPTLVTNLTFPLNNTVTKPPPQL